MPKLPWIILMKSRIKQRDSNDYGDGKKSSREKKLNPINSI